MSRIRVLEVSGSFHQMGKQHGEAYHAEIHHFTEDRVKLSSSKVWTGRELPRETILELADACVAEHQAYSPELMDELRGMAEVTGLSLGELIINNGFTDFIDVVYAAGAEKKQPELASDNCTAFLVSNQIAADGKGMYGQTWDMHATATPHVILLHGKPSNAPAFLSFTITGCVGMVGMNEHGIAVGINNLLGGDGQVGVTWPFVIRKILMQDNLQSALECITEAKLAGAHNYMLMDKHGNGYNVEAMSSRYHIDALETSLVHTNHCVTETNRVVERERQADSLASSRARLNRAYQLLDDKAITPEQLMALTRDEEAICVRSAPPYYSESAGAAVMRPSTGEFWAVWGLPSENEYERFVI